MLGEAIDAHKAKEFGFVNEVYPAEQLQDAALAIAKRIAAQPLESVRATREFLRASLRPHYAERLATLAQAESGMMSLNGAADVIQTADGQIVVSAYMDEHFVRLGEAIHHPELGEHTAEVLLLV